jgi:hypothetical protein
MNQTGVKGRGKTSPAKKKTEGSPRKAGNSHSPGKNIVKTATGGKNLKKVSKLRTQISKIGVKDESKTSPMLIKLIVPRINDEGKPGFPQLSFENQNPILDGEKGGSFIQSLKNIPENLNKNPNDWSCEDFKSMRGNLTRMCNEE